MEELKNLLKLNLQYFAEGEGESGVEGIANNDEDNNPDDTPDDKSGDKGGDEPDTGDNPDNKRGEEPKFTQTDIDRIVQERLDRERRKQEREREKENQRKKEEDGEFKELYEETKGQLEAIREEALNVKKESLLAKAGYDDEQVQRYKKYLDGESDEDLQTALDDLKADIPPKRQYADPSAGNDQKKVPKKQNLEDKGKSAYQRLKERGKIRGNKNQG